MYFCSKSLLLKNFLHLFVLALLISSCRPTSNIITSKEIAERKGIYAKPNSSNTTVVKTEAKKKKDAVLYQKNRNFTARKLNDTNDVDIKVDNENTSYLTTQLINTASDNLGIIYRSGGITKAGYDCSGLMYSTFKKFDIILPRSSNEMAEVGRKLESNEIKKGDLIFFKTNGRSHINHVGMVIEKNDNEIKFIHSSTQSGVIISSTKEPYYKKTFAQVNRILE